MIIALHNYSLDSFSENSRLIFLKKSATVLTSLAEVSGQTKSLT